MGFDPFRPGRQWRVGGRDMAGPSQAVEQLHDGGCLSDLAGPHNHLNQPARVAQGRFEVSDKAALKPCCGFL